MPAARINCAANAAAEPSHSLNESRALEDSASRRHRLPACHPTQPDAASTRPSMNKAGSALVRKILVEWLRKNGWLKAARR